MNGILDNSLVGLALIVSAGYAAAALGPRSLRRALLGALSRLTARAPAFLRLRRTAQRLEAASAGKAAGACGGCDSCGSEQAPAQHSTAQQPPEAEVRVPVGRIGRRDPTAVKPPKAVGDGLR
jgi:hypothetical protein